MIRRLRSFSKAQISRTWSFLQSVKSSLMCWRLRSVSAKAHYTGAHGWSETLREKGRTTKERKEERQKTKICLRQRYAFRNASCFQKLTWENIRFCRFVVPHYSVYMETMLYLNTMDSDYYVFRIAPRPDQNPLSSRRWRVFEETTNPRVAKLHHVRPVCFSDRSLLLKSTMEVLRFANSNLWHQNIDWVAAWCWDRKQQRRY
jgi:hypothetical protein